MVIIRRTAADKRTQKHSIIKGTMKGMVSCQKNALICASNGWAVPVSSWTLAVSPWSMTRGSPPNPNTELTQEAVENCDYITLTHGHHDHIMDIPPLAEKFDPYVFCGERTSVPLMRFANLNPMKVYPMYPDLELDLDTLKVRAVYGQHTPLPGNWTERERRLQVGDPPSHGLPQRQNAPHPRTG